MLTFRMSRRDGVYIWVEGRYRYLPEDGGTVTVLRDITARKEAEDALADAFKQLEAANCLLQALALDSPFALVTISIGVCSVVPLHQEDLAEGVLGAADRALYQAKRAGRNRVVAARMREASSALHAEAGTP